MKRTIVNVCIVWAVITIFSLLPSSLTAVNLVLKKIKSNDSYHPGSERIIPSFSCNTQIAFKAPEFDNLSAQINDGVASVIPLCIGSVNNIGNLIDNSTSNFTTISITGLNCDAQVGVKDNDASDTYPAGTWAGYRIATTGLLGVSIAASVTISTYNNNVLAESKIITNSGLSINTYDVLSDGTAVVGMTTTLPFDEIRIKYQSLVAVLFTATIYHPVVSQFCAGPSPSCNLAASWVNPAYPVFIDNSGVTGLGLSGITNEWAVLDSSQSNAATVAFPIAVLASAYISVKDRLTTYPTGYFAGFEISLPSSISVNISQYVTITTHLNDVQQEFSTGPDLLLAIPFSNSSSKIITGFVSTMPFNEIRLTIAQPLGINLNTISIYRSIIKRYCEGPPLSCNLSSELYQPDFPVELSSDETGFSGLACLACEINYPTAVVNNDTSDYTEIKLLSGVGTTASIAVEKLLHPWADSMFIGFDIETNHLLDVNILDAIQMCIYENDVLKECKTGSSGLLQIESQLLSASSRRTIGFVSNYTFDQVKLSLYNTASITLGTVKVYDLFIDSLCKLNIECDSTYFLNQPDLPVVINGFNSGIKGAVCALCSIQNEQDVISPSTTDYAEIVLAVGTLAYGSISVLDGLSTFPTGISAGFTIRDMGGLTRLDLFESITVCTWLNGSLQECKSDVDLIDLSLLVNLFGPASGMYNVGFHPTLPFDEISIKVSSLASVINIVRVYGAFIDTRGGNVNGLSCCVYPGTVELGSYCVGQTTSLAGYPAGYWTSSNPAIVSISSGYLAQGVAAGTAQLSYYNAISLCLESKSNIITVNDLPLISGISPASLCIGDTAHILPASGGAWLSSNNQIATIDNAGNISALAPGKVGFTFKDATTQCESSSSNDLLTILHCLDPDFNAGFTLLTLTGNLATNDEFPGTSYSNATTTLKKPMGATANLTVQSSGTYTFVGDLPGRYEFSVPVCRIYSSLQCQNQNLAIYLVNRYGKDYFPIVNTDMITVINKDNPVSNCLINLCCNDKCITNDDCFLSRQSQLVTTDAVKGSADFDSSDTLYYAPTPSMRGLDTLYYRFCSDVVPTICDTAVCIITISDSTAVNTVVAVDDLFTTRSDSMLIGQLLINDSDPEGNNFQTIAVGSAATPVILPQGRYYITNTGILYFTPTASFAGPLDIVYTICDDGTPSACSKATAHILVFRDLKIRIKAFLEGALMNSSSLSSTGKPMMRDDLRNEPNTGKNLIPLADPFQFATAFSDMTQNFIHKWPGNMSRYRRVSDSTSVFGVTGDNAIVDWVFVELRNKSNPTQILATRSALIQRDGDVVDLTGNGSLIFRGTQIDSCFIALHHRTHLGVMSKKTNATALVDFTSYLTQPFDFGTTLNNGYDYTGLAQNVSIKPGYRALWSGDFVKNGKIKFTNPSDDLNSLFFDILSHPDNLSGNSNYNFAYGYYQGDYNLDGKIKFDNPADDKNMLYAQIIFYPLNFEYLTNFDFFLEQIPK